MVLKGGPLKNPIVGFRGKRSGLSDSILGVTSEAENGYQQEGALGIKLQQLYLQ